MTGYGHSWHQAHDQATVLLLVPYDTLPEDVFVQIEQHYLIAGVKDQAPLIKGRLYGSVEPESSTWQLEPRATLQQLHERTRTTSTTSTVSNASSYAVVSSDPDISSSFAASLASGRQSVADDNGFMSTYAQQVQRRAPSVHSSPASHPQTPLHPHSIPASPRITESSWASSLSSRSSSQLQLSRAGRLLTIYLEKSDSIIWPSVIVGPVPTAIATPYPSPPGVTNGKDEEKYNMDPISLGVIGAEQAEAGHKEEAFEYFVRAWHQAHSPLSTIRLVPYLPPTASAHLVLDAEPEPGSGAYYLMRFGGVSGLARLYLEAGLLYLEGVADTYLPRSYTDTADGDSTLTLTAAEAAAESEKWKQEKEIARRLFDRARMLDPHLDIPTLPVDEPDLSKSELRMPDVSIDTFGDLNDEKPRRRRRKQGESMVEQASRDSREGSEDSDGTWYVWLPGIIGAGTALLAVGLIGAMSIGSWRKSQNS